MILDGVLAAAGDDDDVVDAGGDRLFDAVLDDRLVDEDQHFLGLGFRGREEAGAEPRRGKDGLPNRSIHCRDPNSDKLTSYARSGTAQRGNRLHP
ncbi:hypothetical protein D3C83_51710 [compost metagenome]